MKIRTTQPDTQAGKGFTTYHSKHETEINPLDCPGCYHTNRHGKETKEKSRQTVGKTLRVEGQVGVDSVLRACCALVEVHYEGKLIDGTVFDSSYTRNQPATFRPNQVIKGWTEALKMMPEGSIYELTIPYNLAYGERGNQAIPPYATLIFKVEVLKVKTGADKK